MSGVEIKKSYEEINQKIKEGKAVVVTAEEMPEIVKKEGVDGAFKKVDVVTTGTFGAMCSSGAFLNFGHTRPRMKMSKVWLNNVEAYGGVAAVDCYIGATQVQDNDPLNMVHPGKFKYGGGHVIEDLIAGKKIRLKATGYGTDCYPLKEYETMITIKDLKNAIMFNPRNAYQNYNCAVNLSRKTIYTYMGILKPDMANATYSSAGQLSPLLNDPYYWTIGTGTRIFLCGAAGSVVWHGTQHAPDCKRGANGIPCEGSGTLAVMGDMKEMDPRYVRGASFTGYGCSIMIGIGIPIPIINRDMAFFTGQSDRDLRCQVVDYGNDYSTGTGRTLGEITYAELKTGRVEFMGKTVDTAPLSSYPMARKIAQELKEWIMKGFTIGMPQTSLPTVPYKKDRDDEAR
ncbi:MAG TPA: homocysteine biosynthesis protein [Spirochaetota bacterium]|nr:homocysteine biosynthesis protein [Spirochaetota bacterium]HPV42148.1 homocysteine biosynthesis protein [Spirochaetota bacterium]